MILGSPGMSPQLYAVSRFTISAGAMSPFLFRISSRKVLWRALVIGLFVAFGYIGQAIGLLTTTAAKSSFICSLVVVFIPLYVGLTGGRIDRKTLLASFFAATGVGIMELGGVEKPVIGDLFSLAQVIGFGLGYVKLERLVKDHPADALPVTAVKLLVVALSSWAFFIVRFGTLPSILPAVSSAKVIACLLWTGLVTSALSLAVESFVLQKVDASSASVIFTSEPLWATLVAIVFIGEHFRLLDGIGGALIITACLLKVSSD